MDELERLRRLREMLAEGPSGIRNKLLPKIDETISLKGNAESTRSRFMNLVNEITARGRGMADAPALTAEDLFGEQMSRLDESARQGANSLKSALSRSIMSGGGDISGVTGSAMLNVEQGAEQTIGDNRLRFSGLADQINRQNEGRGLSLFAQGLQGSQNIMSLDQQLLQQMIQRRAMEEQARKNRRAAILGSIFGGAGRVLSAGIGGGGATPPVETV